MSRLTISVLVFCACSGTLIAQDPPYYKKLDTWQHTLQASLEDIENARLVSGDTQPLAFSSWLSIGPFLASSHDAFAEAFPPEREFTPDTAYGGGKLRWTPRPAWRDGSLVNFEETDYCAMYLTRTLQAPHDTVLSISLGSDDGIKLWLDGKLLFGHDIYRGLDADQDHLEMKVPRGEHRLLLKINNGQGGFGYYFAVQDIGRQTLARLLARDFPSERDKLQMAWETADSIWSTPWHPGDFAELAHRYASMTLLESPADREKIVSDARGAHSGAALDSIRSRYLQAREADSYPVVLTPLPPHTPRINGAKVFGVRPGNPFLFSIAASGDRPMHFSARGLPSGLAIDSETGHIGGSLAHAGTFHMTLEARNKLGRASRPFTIVCGSQIALTPPLGWNSWNCFASAVDDAKVRAAANAMVASGLSQHGWTYINIDDCWEVRPGSDDPVLGGEVRTSEGRIRTNKKFPDMKALSEFVHSKGLKLGIYSSPGPTTCAGFTASYRFEQKDADQYAEWGIDYLKYDWCSYGSVEAERTLDAYQKPYRVMRHALDNVHRDIVFSLCQYGMGDVWQWGGSVGGNSWRTTGDIVDTWESMSEIGFNQAGHELYAKPGNWNDPDMLVVGKVGWGPELHQTRLTPNEQYTHITLWCMLSAPLLIGCDMTQLDAFTLGLLTNDEVLAVSQDSLGRQAARVRKSGDIEVWAKPLSDGSIAVALFNRGRWPAEASVSWGDLGIRGTQKVRDLWRQKDLGRFADALTHHVPRHGAVLLRIQPVGSR